ncbi:MAG: three-Cys-motif partner protein TcmP [Acidobacteriota bacterium]
MTHDLKLDEIGNWSEVKLEIVKKYAQAYSTILSKKAHLRHAYIDGFSGPGVHLKKLTGEMVKGSPLNALEVTPPFKEFFLVDLDGDKVELLKGIVGEEPGVHVFQGDCNKILLEQVFPHVRYEDYRRGLCLLDPYGLHLDWCVILKAGSMKSLEIFLNFPIADINRNVLRKDQSTVLPSDMVRMTRYWGDESWREELFKPSPQLSLFGEPDQEKESNEAVAAAFRERLRVKAGFTHVPEPLPMRNSKGAIVYFLFFAAQQPVAAHIVEEIFTKYR